MKTRKIKDLPGNSPVLRPIRLSAVSAPIGAPERANREFFRESFAWSDPKGKAAAMTMGDFGQGFHNAAETVGLTQRCNRIRAKGPGFGARRFSIRKSVGRYFSRQGKVRQGI
jgi:hypothetical protein